MEMLKPQTKTVMFKLKNSKCQMPSGKEQMHFDFHNWNFPFIISIAIFNFKFFWTFSFFILFAL